MKNVWKYFAIIISMNVNAQNLVPNPSFEDTIGCPLGIGDINKAVGWSSFKLTPDYLNICNDNQAGVPSNLFGYQSPRTGNAYAGLYSYSLYTSNYREIIGVQLLQPLVIGHYYYAEFYVSRGFHPNPGYRINVSTNKLGVRFTTMEYSPTVAIPIDNFSQVFTDSVIYDTTNWIKISGSFISDSAYHYLAIGNFFSDSATSESFLDTTASLAYYYVDDILVIDSTTIGISENEEITSNYSFYENKIVLGNREIVSLSIYDLLGKKRLEISYPAIRSEINIQNFKCGFYIIKINTKTNVDVKKILKQ